MRRPLARFAPVAALCLAALALPACLKQEQKTVLEKDGSGKMSQTVTIDLASLKKVVELAKMLMPNVGNPDGEPGMGEPAATPEIGADDLSAWLDQVTALSKSVPGLKIDNVKKEAKDGKWTASADVTFADLSLLAKVGLFATEGVEIAKNADGSYTLSDDLSGVLSSLLPSITPGGGGAPGGEAPPAPGGEDPMMTMIEQMVGDVALKRVLTVPGTIVETNGTKSEDGKTVTFTAGVKEIFGGKARMTVTFKGEGLELKPFKYAPTLDDLKKAFMGAAKKGEKKPAPETPKDGEKPPEGGMPEGGDGK